jgi:hypothetical protein
VEIEYKGVAFLSTAKFIFPAKSNMTQWKLASRHPTWGNMNYRLSVEITVGSGRCLIWYCRRVGSIYSFTCEDMWKLVRRKVVHVESQNNRAGCYHSINLIHPLIHRCKTQACKEEGLTQNPRVTTDRSKTRTHYPDSPFTVLSILPLLKDDRSTVIWIY